MSGAPPSSRYANLVRLVRFETTCDSWHFRRDSWYSDGFAGFLKLVWAQRGIQIALGQMRIRMGRSQANDIQIIGRRAASTTMLVTAVRNLTRRVVSRCCVVL